MLSTLEMLPALLGLPIWLLDLRTLVPFVRMNLRLAVYQGVASLEVEQMRNGRERRTLLTEESMILFGIFLYVPLVRWKEMKYSRRRRALFVRALLTCTIVSDSTCLEY